MTRSTRLEKVAVRDRHPDAALVNGDACHAPPDVDRREHVACLGVNAGDRAVREPNPDRSAAETRLLVAYGHSSDGARGELAAQVGALPIGCGSAAIAASATVHFATTEVLGLEPTVGKPGS